MDTRSKKIMKLSFVIPAWNEEKYIRQCLASITREAKKSQRDIEIIVVNNASVDRTREIALEFPDVIVVDEPRKGLPQARQAGFLASSGDLIANMDADSILPPGWIAKVYTHFSQDDDLVALSGPYEYYDLPRLTHYLVSVYYLPVYGLHLVTHRLLGKGAVLQGGNFVLRRTALEKIGGFNVDIKFYGEDTDIARRIQKTGRVKFLPSFKMLTSGRRLTKEGFLKMAARYAINYFWVVFFKKPVTEKYACVSDRIK
jgi:glycosyltransferase involved in cell wall biosynthesis